MKPKWGDISKYMGLDKLLKTLAFKNASFLPLKLHVYIHKKVPFVSAATHY